MEPDDLDKPHKLGEKLDEIQKAESWNEYLKDTKGPDAPQVPIPEHKLINPKTGQALPSVADVEDTCVLLDGLGGGIAEETSVVDPETPAPSAPEDFLVKSEHMDIDLTKGYIEKTSQAEIDAINRRMKKVDRRLSREEFNEMIANEKSRLSREELNELIAREKSEPEKPTKIAAKGIIKKTKRT